MTTRRTNGEYPEHLNPFKKSGLRGSFHEIKRTLSIKFRRKDPKKNSIAASRSQSTVRRPSGDQTITLRGNVTGLPPQHKSEIYPRSRFQERAKKAQTLAPNGQPAENPFDDEPEENNNEETCVGARDEASQVPQPVEVDGQKPIKKKRRKKLRAPLPPGLSRVGTSGLNQSQWSISSYETDCSSAAYNSETTQDEHEQEITGSARGLNDIHEISSEIISYCNSKRDNLDSNENLVQDGHGRPTNDEKSTTENNQKSDEKTNDGGEKSDGMTTTGSVEKSDDKATTEDVEKSDGKATTEHAEKCDGKTATDGAKEEMPECKAVEINEATESAAIAETSNMEDVSNNNEKTEPAIEDTLTEEERAAIDAIDQVSAGLNETVLNSRNMEDSKYVEEKSLYITGSCDNLDVSEPVMYKRQVSINITGSRDELATINNKQPK